MELETATESEWVQARERLLAKEKAATRGLDALAAERRRLPAVEMADRYEFDGPAGRVELADLFEGRRQLLLYHFWYPPEGDPCRGCSMFTDQVPELAHLHARDTTLALVSTAPQPQLQAFRERMGWRMPWYTTVGTAFQEARGTTEYFKLDVYLRDQGRVFLTYETRARGVEALGSVWSLLDLTPLGRQEEWEDSPADRPQGPAYGWWEYHDDYDGITAPSAQRALG
jgi:predicted dithiol-disulfide oxidoreductase (DUF899 family)